MSKLSLQEAIDYVQTFHDSFKIHSTDTPTVEVEDRLIDLRHKLMGEENDEYLEAAKVCNTRLKKCIPRFKEAI